LRFHSLFVTGTDTAVGKTTVSCGIAAALHRLGWKVGVFKPSETGCRVGPDGALQPEDATRLQFFSSSPVDLRTICPYPLREPLAPAVAAAHAGVDIRLDALCAIHREIAAVHDVTLIEGAGGLLVPLAPDATFADLAARLDAALVVVVGSRLGAINHALLTVRHARCCELRVLGYVLNFLTPDVDLAARTNVAVLADWLGTALGVVPYLGEIPLTEASRERLGELFATQLRLDSLLVPCSALEHG
jgi:dethiobiotin synthetase